MVMPDVWGLPEPRGDGLRPEGCGEKTGNVGEASRQTVAAPTLQVTFVAPQNLPRVLVIIQPSSDSNGFIDCTLEDAMLLMRLFERGATAMQIGVTFSGASIIDKMRRRLLDVD